MSLARCCQTTAAVGVADVARIDAEQRCTAQDEGGHRRVEAHAGRQSDAGDGSALLHGTGDPGQIVATQVVDRAGPQFLAQRLDLRQVQRLTKHDLRGAELLEVIRFALLPGQRHHFVAARGKHIDGEAADAARGAGNDHGTVAGLQSVLFHAHDAEARGEAGGAQGHRLRAGQPGRQLVHPGGGNSRALGVAAVVGDADVVTGCQDFIARLEARV
jgi:hypothetical protein